MVTHAGFEVIFVWLLLIFFFSGFSSFLFLSLFPLFFFFFECAWVNGVILLSCVGFICFLKRLNMSYFLLFHAFYEYSVDNIVFGHGVSMW